MESSKTSSGDHLQPQTTTTSEMQWNTYTDEHAPDYLNEYMIPVVHERSIDPARKSPSPPHSSSANTTGTTTTPVSTSGGSPPSNHHVVPPPFPQQYTEGDPYVRYNLQPQHQPIKYNPADYSCAIKLLVSNNVAGSIIGRSGQTISELQGQSNTRIKLSQAGDFYPGTQDRVCLIQGENDDVKVALQLLIERLFMLQQQQHTQHLAWQLAKQEAEPPPFDFVVRILIPVASGGMVIGKGGSNIKYMQETTGVVVRLSPKDTVDSTYPPLVNTTSERVVNITGTGMQSCLECLYLIFDEMINHPEMARYTNMTTSYNRIVQEPAAFLRPVISPSPQIEVPSWHPDQPYRRIQSLPDLAGSLALHEDPNVDPDMFFAQQPPMYLMPPLQHEPSPLHTSVSAPDLLATQFEHAHLDARPTPSLEPQTPIMTHPGCFEATVQVPDNMIGSILGRAGRTLNELQMLSNTRIRISQRNEYVPGTKNRLVTIRGPSAQCVWQAQYLMSQRMVLPNTAVVDPSAF